MTQDNHSNGLTAKQWTLIAGTIVLLAIGAGVIIAMSSSIATEEAGPEGTWVTTPPPPGNHPPGIVIAAPKDLSSHEANYDSSSGSFRALVEFIATATDEDGDRFKIDWYSSLDGYLGSGEHITASLVTKTDSSQPTITASATDEHGTTAEEAIQLLVWIPSDS